ncbi:uncharacterized protein LOC106641944 [Copidosoma floridanum]|uniref:uncharacterized protein LOC106641944 n=1 Tax=Copidosoma floridanum TaxID=29053 RepID=UPI0006C941D8|nr:uncharacterized protein LOC106641944 [Copidosoma floridanum]
MASVQADSCNKNKSTEKGICWESYYLLVKKYDALVRVQKNIIQRRYNIPGVTGATLGLSLQEEMQMSSKFSSNLTASGGSEFISGSSRHTGENGKIISKLFASTPTDCLEAETLRSGFIDKDSETNDKATQTEGRPSSFLCSIIDSDECRFSIYDDTSTLKNCFHQTVKYRKLFSEIFELLKRTAEGNDILLNINERKQRSLTNLFEAETLTPLAEQRSSSAEFFKNISSEATDDVNSLITFTISSVASEPTFPVLSPIIQSQESKHQTHHDQKSQQRNQEKKLDATPWTLHTNTRRQPLDYLYVQIRKRNSNKNGRHNFETSYPADVEPTINLRAEKLRTTVSGQRKSCSLTAYGLIDGVNWNGSTAHLYPSTFSRTMQQQQQYYDSQVSTTNVKIQLQQRTNENSQKWPSLAKLRRLEMSYAEVLRMPNQLNTASSHSSHQRRHH